MPSRTMGRNFKIWSDSQPTNSQPTANQQPTNGPTYGGRCSALPKNSHGEKNDQANTLMLAKVVSSFFIIIATANIFKVAHPVFITQ